jgi:hypothetical protein
MKTRRSRSAARIAARIFQERADRFQSECGWCHQAIGEGSPVFGVPCKAVPGVDLFPVQGKVIELQLDPPNRTLLAGVSAFDSDAKRDGADLVFMVCSESCGKKLKAGVGA